jgi:peptide/nickel transport system substrate-binding protein
MHRIDRRRAFALALSWCVVLGACGGASSATRTGDDSTSTVAENESQAVRGGKVVFGLTAESSGWSPVADQWALDGHFVASAVYDPLMAVAPDRRIVPELAEVVEHNAEFTVWTLHLRRDVEFHDGSSFDAAAVKANLEASRHGLGAVTLTPIAAVDAVDASTVVITMRTPWSAFPSALAGQQGYMASPASLADGTASTHPVGTGPFAYEQWVPDHRFVLRRNDHYWQADKPYLDELEFRPIADNVTRRAALESGALDLLVTYEPSDVTAYRSRPEFRVLTDRRAEETVVVLNAGRPPFDDPTVREAIAKATDHDLVAETLGAGVLETADGPFAPGERWYSDDTRATSYDLDAARSLVDDYRARTGQALRFRLSTFPDPTRLRQAQLLQQMWTRAGAEVQIVTLDQASFIKPLINGDLEAAVISNFGTADPDFNYLFWHSSLVAPPGQLSINFSHTADPVIDAALDAARRTDDIATRARHYQEVVRRLNEDFAYIWLYRTPTTLVASEKVHGLASLGDAGFGRPDGKPWLAHLWMVA